MGGRYASRAAHNYRPRHSGIIPGRRAVDNAGAQTYPTRPITIIVPYPAGGPTDTLARVLAERMKAALGQSVIIENVTGAGGSIGVGRVARAAPDGYTLSIGHNQTHVINAASMNLPYDVVKDFEPVSLIADTPQWLISRKTLPANDVKELVAWLKANKATAGSVGVGGPTDLSALSFQKQTGTQFQFVPYRGGAPLLQDLVGGPDRLHVRPGGELSRPGSRRPAQGLRGAVQAALVGGARRPDHGRGRRAGASRLVLAWPLGAEGHAEGDHRQARRRRRSRRWPTRPCSSA